MMPLKLWLNCISIMASKDQVEETGERDYLRKDGIKRLHLELAVVVQINLRLLHRRWRTSNFLAFKESALTVHGLLGLGETHTQAVERGKHHQWHPLALHSNSLATRGTSQTVGLLDLGETDMFSPHFPLLVLIHLVRVHQSAVEHSQIQEDCSCPWKP